MSGVLCADGSNVLKQVVVPTINYDDCKRIYEAARKILPHDVICLGVPAGGKSACHGDSGGPMVCKRDGKWWQYGVTDFVWSKTSCAGPNQPFGYADVVAYLPWIQQNSGGLCRQIQNINTYFIALADECKLIENVLVVRE